MVVKLKSGFEVLRLSDLAYEGMTTEVNFEGEPIAQLNMDHGADTIEIELFTKFSRSSFTPRFSLEQLLEAIGLAKEVLLEYPDPTKPPQVDSE